MRPFRKLPAAGLLALAACASPTGPLPVTRLPAGMAERLEAVRLQNHDGDRYALERLTVRQEGSQRVFETEQDAYAFNVIPAGEAYDWRSRRMVSRPAQYFLSGEYDPAAVVADIEDALRAERAVQRAYREE